MRMSGEPSCAITEPSRNSTRPWTTDCGWTMTSSSSGDSREQMMRLDQFEALVHQRRGIDRDLRPHDPGRMLERLLHRHFAQLLQRPGAERPAGGGQDDATHFFAPARHQRLEDRVVLGIDRQDCRAGGGRAAHEQGAGTDQAFLVGERDRRAAFGRSECRLQARGAGDRRHDPIGRPLRRLDQGIRRRRRLRCRSRKVRPSIPYKLRHRPPRQSARRVRAPAAPARRRCGLRSPPPRDSARARVATDRWCSNRSSRWRQASVTDFGTRANSGLAA